MAIPQGFELMPTLGAFHELAGPMYMRRASGALVAGLLLQDKHRNLGGSIHGGMLSTFVDSAFAYAVRSSREPPVRGVTATMSLELMGSAAPGEWLEAPVDIVRAGKRVVFLNCFVYCAGRRIARASATFQIVGDYVAADGAGRPSAAVGGQS
jgi:acyl-coenzyme A thioesterase PaaI-like protein